MRDQEDVSLVTAEGSPMRGVLAQLTGGALGGAHVLLSGEQGTGREALARHLHALSGRAGPFVVLRSTAASEERVIDELFGEGGDAFPGRRGGALDRARGGTLFVEELTDLPPSAQAALAARLRRGNQARTTPGGARVVAATARDLAWSRRVGLLRRDLHGAFACSLGIPALRDRAGDAVAIFARLWAERGGGRLLDAAAVTLLRWQRWPGNVPELDAFVSRLALLVDADPIGAADVAAQLWPAGASIPPPGARERRLRASAGASQRAAPSPPSQ